ncbi:MAG: nucleotidyl transferase AbiEii/AbiGii toxin family protein [Candidatus Moraniibacteriota bacterium]
MYPETIDPGTKRVLDTLTSLRQGSGVAGVVPGFLDSFYLAGGTALAIELGHRRSIDLDFFSSEDFRPSDIRLVLSKAGELVVVGEDVGTLHITFDGVKVSFLRYRYRMLFDAVGFEGVKLADERDIAAMKIDAIASRGSRKDFVDLFVLLEKYTFQEILGFFEHKFEGIGFNTLHILKSLVFFEDAEGEPMPMMLRDISWEVVKKTIADAVMDFEREQEMRA